MDSTIRQLSGSAYVVIGPEGATNFAIIKARDGSAALIDADIRRIDEVEAALRLTGCAKVSYLIDTHEHFDHTSANFYFAQRGVPIVASAGCVQAIKDDGAADFTRMLKPVPELYERFPGLRLTLPDVVFDETAQVKLPRVTLHLQYRAENGHSHSKGDTTIYFEEEEVFIAGDLLYTALFETHYKHLVPGHGPTVDGEQSGMAYFKKMHDYLEDFHGHLEELKFGRKSESEVAQHMQSGAYAALGKSRMVERNINHFLTERWF